MKVEFYLKLGGNLPQMTFYLHEHYSKTETSFHLISFGISLTTCINRTTKF